VGRLGSRVPALGIRTLSDLQIDTDKDWRAHGIYNLGDLTPKVDGAYNIGSSAAEFDIVYAKAGPPPGADSIGREELKEPAVDSAYLYDNAVAPPKLASDSIYKRHLRTGVVDTSYLTDDAATSAKVGPSVDLEFVRSNDNVVAGGITPKVDGAYNLGSPTVQFNNAYASNIPPLVTEPVSNAAGDLDSVRDVSSGALALQNLLAVADGADVVYQPELSAGTGASIFDDANLTVSKGADIAYQTELMPVKFADIFDHPNLGSTKAKDIVYHANFNLPSAEARDKVAESTYGVAKDVTGVKGFVYQLHEKRDFAFRTETPNHAYWHRMYNTPAAFETVYQDYTTSMQKKGTTPSKSAPGTADPNPQPGACWSVSMLPDGTRIGGWASPGSNPIGISWDGTYLWNADDAANYIYQLKTDGTATGGGFTSPATSPRSATWDGAYLWVSSLDAGYIYHLKTDGTQVGGFASPGSSPDDVSWDGTYLWNADHTASYIYQLKTDGTQVGGFTGPCPNPSSMGWDGAYLWTSGWNADYLYQLKTDGTQVGGFAHPGPSPAGAGWDGAYLRVGDGAAGYVYQFGNAGNFDVNYRIFAK